MPKLAPGVHGGEPPGDGCRSLVSRTSELPPAESLRHQPIELWLPLIGVEATASRTFGACTSVSGPVSDLWYPQTAGPVQATS